MKQRKQRMPFSREPLCVLEPSFFCCDTLTVARELLGCFLVHDSPSGLIAGKIVETEAYLAEDPACHAFRGETLRTAPLFADAGTLYIYLIYGVHRCFNLVTRERGVGEAVLIRALEPVHGLELMRHNRSSGKSSGSGALCHRFSALSDVVLCNGPAKLVQALGLVSSYNGLFLPDSPVSVLRGAFLSTSSVVQTTRVGITQGAALPYRFYVRGNRFVSKM